MYVDFRLLNESSGKQQGTLSHLKNLIKATSVLLDPKDNLKAAEDFFMIVFTAYVIAAAKEVLNTGTVLSVSELAQQVVDKYVRVLSTPVDIQIFDRVLTYSSEIITLGTITMMPSGKATE